MFEKNSVGLDSFCWFFGIVEGRQDPLKLGRVRVRAFGWHDDSLAAIPTEHLPWAQCIGGRDTETQYRDGDMIFGLFSDGRSAQKPFVVGLVNGNFTVPNDTSKGFNDLRAMSELQNAPRFVQSAQYNTDGSGIKITEQSAAPHHPNSLEINTPTITGVAFNKPAGTVIAQRQQNLDTNVNTANGQSWSEPKPAYMPVYPYDRVYASESGHVVEIDDTPGHERIAVQHRSGSFTEWMPTGSVVEKVTKTKYTILMADDNIHVMGKVRITVSGDAYIQVVGDCNLEVDNDINAGVAGDANFSIGGDFNVSASGINLQASGDVGIKGQSVITQGDNEVGIQSGSTLNLKGSDVLIGGSTVAVNGGSLQNNTPWSLGTSSPSTSNLPDLNLPSPPDKVTPSSGTPSVD